MSDRVFTEAFPVGVFLKRKEMDRLFLTSLSPRMRGAIQAATQPPSYHVATIFKCQQERRDGRND